ncbi:MAG: hypothetical protein PHO91_02750 [Patescibacteria group bacterium]|nr:hypothetical protein [Patescibacteria group bacterium]
MRIKYIIAIFLFFTLLLGLNSSSQIKAQVQSYAPGSLLSAIGGSAVYYIAPDGKKYVFPESKTYFTWFDDFSQVKKVASSILDQYPDGGAMPVREGTKLITHQNTARVYALEPNGLTRWIPSEEIAIDLFGLNWASRVIDVLPGFFATTYSLGSNLSDMLPSGALVRAQSNNRLYYIAQGKKIALDSASLRTAYRLKEGDAILLSNLARYPDATSSEQDLANYVNTFIPRPASSTTDPSPQPTPEPTPTPTPSPQPNPDPEPDPVPPPPSNPNDPHINSVSGSLIQGATLSITGSNFGFKSTGQAAPYRWDDFQNGTPGNVYVGRNIGGVNAGPFDTQGSCRVPYYSNAIQRKSGDIVLLQDFNNPIDYFTRSDGSIDSSCAYNKAIEVRSSPSQTWYVSYWGYQDDYDNTAFQSDNVKIYGNLYYRPQPQYPQARWDENWCQDLGEGCTGNGLTGSGGVGYVDCNLNQSAGSRSSSYRNNTGRWVRIERMVTMGTPLNANGFSRGYNNLDLIADISGVFLTQGCESSVFDTLAIGHYFRNGNMRAINEGTNRARLRHYISELYVDHTFSRVEIGNAATWDATSHREIQVPKDTWNNSQINISVNLGSFNQADISNGLYLFVVNQDNVPSQGYRLNL